MKKLLIALFALALIGGIAAWYFYDQLFGTNVTTSEDPILYIESDSGYDDLLTKLESKYIKDIGAFKFTAKRMSFEASSVKSGRYNLEGLSSNVDLIRHLRSGNQEPVPVVINHLRTLEELSEEITENLELSASDYLAYLKSSEAAELLDESPENLMTRFIPNTYSLYWDVSAKDLTARMLNEHDKFWKSNEREEKLEHIGLTREQAYTLASIVEKESLMSDERPRIAGVYLNRLKKGMLLQADPTVIFAVGDFSIRRVLHKHLRVDSPYNTYKYQGLPIGPICMPSISSIDAVLNAEDHQYLYFCAKPDFSGYHNFAKTLRQHNNYANAYRRAL